MTFFTSLAASKLYVLFDESTVIHSHLMNSIHQVVALIKL